jgi:hypothetical protein
MQVILGGKVVMDEVIAKSFHIGMTARFGSAIGVGCSEVRWIFA